MTVLSRDELKKWGQTQLSYPQSYELLIVSDPIFYPIFYPRTEMNTSTS